MWYPLEANRSFTFELKQLTGVEACQCRKARIQREFGGQMHLSTNTRRNHIACALLVWTPLKAIAYHSDKTIYQIKHGMLSDYLPIATQASVHSNDSCVSPEVKKKGIA